MMRFLRLLSVWILSSSFFLFFISTQFIEADPTDDFSFSLPRSTHKGIYRVLSTHQLSQILEDHLDLFPKSLIIRLSQHIEFLCKKYRFDPAFILSLISVESGFRIRAVSPMNAIGLMQIRLSTAQFVIGNFGYSSSGFENFDRNSIDSDSLNIEKLKDPFVNISIGIKYLAWLRDRFKGSFYYVLAAYNMGPARMHALLARKSFEPVKTKRYFHAVRRKIPNFRFYQRVNSPMRNKIKSHLKNA